MANLAGDEATVNEREICEAIGADVIGELPGGGVKLFSVFHGKNIEIDSADKLTIHWWQLPSWLGLDAPCVVSTWCLAIAHSTGKRPAGVVMAALFLTVWSIYLADRLTDVARCTDWRSVSGRMRLLSSSASSSSTSGCVSSTFDAARLTEPMSSSSLRIISDWMRRTSSA